MRFISILLLLGLLSSLGFAIDIDNCTNISSPDMYNLTQNVAGAPVNATPLTVGSSCIRINVSDVVFDCNGFNITNNGTNDGYGIFIISNTYGVHLTNITVLDCPGIANYSAGIWMYFVRNSSFYNNTAFNNSGSGFRFEAYSQNNSIANNTAYNNSLGIYLVNNAYNNSVIGNLVYNNTGSGFDLDGYASSNTLRDNVAHGNAAGFYFVVSADNNTMINNTACNNSGYGFYFSGGFTSNNNSMVNNTMYNNTIGLRLEGENSSFIGTTIFNNSVWGIMIGAPGNQFWNTTLYNNGNDFEGGSTPYNMTNTTFLNPSGTLANYTSLSISDTAGIAGLYTINWSSQPALPSAGFPAIGNKYVNISIVVGTPSIDNITWSWLDSESTDYDESKFGIWKYNESGWSNVSAVLDGTANTLSIANFNPESVYGILQGPACQVIDVSGDYQMAENLVGAPIDASEMGGVACVKITTSNVVLDCNGYNITNNGTATAYGVALNGSITNVTVANCPAISGYSNGIYVYQSNDSYFSNNTAFNISSYSFYVQNGFNNTFLNNTAYNDTRGFVISSGSYNNLTGNSAYNGTNAGFFLDSGSNNTLAFNFARNNTVGFNLNPASSSNNLTNNTAITSVNGFILSSASNYNVLIGNNASNSTNYGFWLLGGSNNNNFTGNIAFNNSNSGFVFDSSGSSVLANNTAYNNTNYGFYFGSSGNVISGSLAYNNSADGFFVETGGFNILVNNTVFNNILNGINIHASNNNATNNTVYGNQRGISVAFGSNNTLADDAVYGNLQYGIVLDRANATRISNAHLYGAAFSPDIRVDNSVGATPFILNVSGAIFDNPAGGFQSYTNLTINDLVEAGTGYDTFWNSAPASPPPNYASFRSKFADIVTTSGTVSIDSIAWSWQDSEVTAGYNESKFELWKYSTGWSNQNATLDIAGNTLNISNLDPASTYAILQNGNCPVIDQSGSYQMNGSFTGAPNDASPLSNFSCVKIAASNVDFDCNGYNITNNGTAGTTYGILLNGSLTNVTVRNCAHVFGYTYGVEAFQSTGVYIYNTTVSGSTGAAFIANSGTNVTYANNVAYNSSSGFEALLGSNHTYLNNTAYNLSSEGFLSSASSYDTFANNTAYGAFDGFALSSSSHSSLANNTAHGCRSDGFFFTNTATNNTLANNIARNNSGYGFGFQTGSGGNNLTNNTAYNNTFAGFNFYSSAGNILINNTAYRNPTGFSVFGTDFSPSSSNTLINNTAYNNTGTGFEIHATSDFNSLTGNTAYNNTDYGFTTWVSHNNNFTSNSAYNSPGSGFRIELSANNTLANNTIYGNSQTGMYLLDSNFTIVNGVHFYNDGNDMILQDVAGSTHVANISAAIFDNPAGDFQNYTNLTINDVVEPNTEYAISWATNSSGITPGFFSVAGKFINITTGSGAPSIASVTWRWTAADAAGQNESMFQLWKYNLSTGWTRLNNTPDTTAHVLSLSNLNPSSIYAILQQNDTTVPSIQLNGPPAGYSITTPGPVVITFNFTAIDDFSPTLNCSLYLNNTFNFTNSSVLNNTPTNMLVLLSPGAYVWNVTCTDLANNTNSSATYLLTLALPVVPPSAPSAPSPPTLSLSYDINQPENTVVITTESGARIRLQLIDPYAGLVGSATADDSGQASFRLTQNGTYEASGTKTGYSEGTVTFHFTTYSPPAPECVRDSDCPANNTCTANRCVAQQPQQPPENVTPPVQPQPGQTGFGCTDDSGCSFDQFCSNRTCQPVTGKCGYPLNHAWVGYACCADADCGGLNICRDHACATPVYALVGKPSGYVGEQNPVSAYSDGLVLPDTPLKVTKPDGSYEVVTTDAHGNINLSLEQAGTYTIDLLINGTAVKTFKINSLGVGTPPVVPPKTTVFDTAVAAGRGAVLLVVVAVVAFLVYRFYFAARGGKGYKK